MRLLCLLSFLVATPAYASSPEQPDPEIEWNEDLTDAVILALEGKRRALKRIKQLSTKEDLTSVRGVAALLLKDHATARLLLQDRPEAVVYYAMARAHSTGGLSQARAALAEVARGEDPPAGALFLAALAFARAKQPDQADRLLQRAMKRTPAALDEAFAPDPAVGLVRFTARILQRRSARERLFARLAGGLLHAGRRGYAIQLAEAHRSALGSRQVLMKAWEKVDPTRALAESDRILAKDPNLGAVRAHRARLLLQTGDIKAKKALANIDTVPQQQRSLLSRMRARVALKEGDNREALRHAQDAARSDPKSDRAVALVAEALLALGKTDRALAFAEELLRRKPIDLDPFDLLAKIHDKRGGSRKLRELRLRSTAFRQEQQRLRAAGTHREEVIRAVRDADGGIGVTGLSALRGEEPMLALALDLALARHGRPGSARAARDRVFAACAPRFAAFLKHTGSWDHVPVAISPYGKVQKVKVDLTAADPGRCASAPQRTRKPKGKRSAQ